MVAQVTIRSERLDPIIVGEAREKRPLFINVALELSGGVRTTEE